MGFNELIAKCNQRITGKFSNVTVNVTLSGVAVGVPFPAVFDESSEVVSPWESEKVLFKPLLSVESKYLNGVTSANVLEISGVEYKFDGKPRRDGAGMALIHLAVKK
jgi:hypothetical protein